MSKHKIYKYRSLEPWEFFLDILVNERLFAANFRSLNDPMEGLFTYSQDENPSFIQQMLNHKTQLAICSLSAVHNSAVMWAYYSDSHKGIVLEAEIDSSSPNVVAVEPITYSEQNEFVGFLGSNAAIEARKVLSKKNTAWKHEKEIRVFSSNEYVPIKLRKIYLGCEMPNSRRDLIIKLTSRICPEIEVCRLNKDDLDANFGT